MAAASSSRGREVLSSERSREFLAVLAHYEPMQCAGQSDLEGEATLDLYYRAVRNYLATAPSIAPLQRLVELNVIWRLECWDLASDSKDQTVVGDEIELLISDTIEELTGVVANQRLALMAKGGIRV
jgi:hypothetical protein